MNLTQFEKELLESKGLDIKLEYSVPDLVAVLDEDGNVLKERLGRSVRTVQRLMDDGSGKKSKPTTLSRIKAAKRGKSYYVMLPNLIAYLKGEKQYSSPDPAVISEISQILIDQETDPAEYFLGILNNLKQNQKSAC